MTALAKLKHTTKRARRRDLRATSLEECLDAALAIIDRGGIDSLTIRNLADELGIGTMTIYSYVNGKDDLLDKIAAQILGGVCESVPIRGSWDVRLAKMMTSLHDMLHLHAGVAAISVTPRGPIAALDSFREELLRILHDAGFPPPDAVNALTALVTYVTGYSMVEHARTEAHVEQERLRLASLPKDQFPLLAEAAELYATQFSQRTFRAGLRSLIDGLKIELAGLRKPSKKRKAVRGRMAQ
jgi:AcrR family transcriptional regulator